MPYTDILRITLTAGEALSKNRFVEVDGTYPAAAGNAIGVAWTEADNGADVTVTVLGTAEVEASAAIAKGAAIAVTAEGKAVTHASGNVVVGRALEAAAKDGDVIEVFLVAN